MSRCTHPECGRQLDEDGDCWVPGHSKFVERVVSKSVIPRLSLLAIAEASVIEQIRSQAIVDELTCGDFCTICKHQIDEGGSCACTVRATGVQVQPVPVWAARLPGPLVLAADFPPPSDDRLVPSEILRLRPQWREATSADFLQPSNN